MTDAAGAAIAAACGNAVSAEIGAEGDADCASDPATVTFAGEASSHNPTPPKAAMATAAINPATPRVRRRPAGTLNSDAVKRSAAAIVGELTVTRSATAATRSAGASPTGAGSTGRDPDPEQPRLRPVRPEFAHRRSKREVAE